MPGTLRLCVFCAAALWAFAHLRPCQGAGSEGGRAAPSQAPAAAEGRSALPVKVDDRAARLRDLTAQWEAPRKPILRGFHNLYNLRIVAVPDAGYPFRMWFFGWAAADSNPVDGGKHLGDAIYHARSRDLFRWEVYAGRDAAGQPQWDVTENPRLWEPVMAAGKKVFDSAANGDPSVVLRDGVYTMAFSSVGFDARADTTPQHMYLVNCVMGARSTDGITWEKTRAPILIWGKEYENRWDIAPDGKAPAPPDYYGSYHRPSLLFDEGRWRIWFDYYHPGTFVSLGCAENRGSFMDPNDWKVLRADRAPLLRDWPNPSVVRVGERYYAFADAPGYPAEMGGDGRQITVAQSSDGLEWEVLGHVRPEGRESSHVPEAFLYTDREGTWLYLFYAWKPETRSDAEWDYRYKELRYLRQRVPPGAE